MAATNKTDLLEITRKEYQKLTKLIDQVDDEKAMHKADEVSIKDVIGHRAHWIEMFMGWYEDGVAGKPVSFPAEGYKWSDLKRYNANLRKQQEGLDWKGAKAMLDASYRRLSTFLDNLPEEELYGGPMKGANNKWTPGRWAEAAGPSHFRSASKFIRSALRT